MPMQAGTQVLAAHSFTAEGEGELTIAQNAVLFVVESETEQNAGWLLVKSQDGRSGYVPIDFLRETGGGGGALQQQQQQNDSLTSSFKQKAQARMSVTVPPAMQQQYTQQQQQPTFDRQGNFQASPWGLPQPPPPAAGYYPSSGGGGGAGMWAQRDGLYGPQARTPIPTSRRWYYRDLFGDMQGPFNAEEMRQRVDAKHIQPDTFCVIEVGAGAVQKHEEKKLRDLFPSIDVAFHQPCVLPGSKAFWYYLDDARQEHGPFSSDQMRLWFDVEGYFGSRSLVREAQAGAQFVPLGQVFQDPMVCFIGGAQPTPAAATNNGYQEPPSFQIIDPFNSSPAQPAGKSNSSSRQLLQAALAGGPPPAIGKPGAPQQKSAAEEDEDDTLALFDKIEIDEGSKKASPAETAAKTKANFRVYGTASAWPAWKGVPNFEAKADSFPTILYHFFTRPLNPYAGKILCHITREINGIGNFNYNKYILYLENETGPQATAVAIRHSGPMSTSFDIKLLTKGRADDLKSALTVAKLETNFLGTQFLLHNAVAGHQGKAKDLACVLYDANRMGKGGPRKMRVGIPDVEEAKCEYKVFPHGATGSASMLTSLQSINATNLVPMLNKPPKWNAAREAYSLDFGGRVTRASVKNFQLVDAIHDPEHENVILQHGRVAQDKFTMDVQHPMSLLQAFAVCLSSLDQKKGVD